jgi:hypothetical protein
MDGHLLPKPEITKELAEYALHTLSRVQIPMPEAEIALRLQLALQAIISKEVDNGSV